MTTLFPNLKRTSPSLYEGVNQFYLPNNNNNNNNNTTTNTLVRSEDELILPPVSSFMKTATPGSTQSPAPDPVLPLLPSLQELRLLPERLSTASTTAVTLGDLPLTFPSSIASTPIDDNRAPRTRRQYKRRPNTTAATTTSTATTAGAVSTLTFNNTTTGTIVATTPSFGSNISTQSKTLFNLFDKSVEASVEGFGRVRNSPDDAQKTALDLLLLGEAAADIEKEEEATSINNEPAGMAAGTLVTPRYSPDQDISMPSSLVPSSACSPQPQMPILTVPQIGAAGVTSPIGTAQERESPKKKKDRSAGENGAPKIRMFEGKGEKGGLKVQADGGAGASQEPRARRRSSAINKDSLYCHFCGRRNTPEWRKGPDGPAT